MDTGVTFKRPPVAGSRAGEAEFGHDVGIAFHSQLIALAVLGRVETYRDAWQSAGPAQSEIDLVPTTTQFRLIVDC